MYVLLNCSATECTRSFFIALKENLSSGLNIALLVVEVFKMVSEGQVSLTPVSRELIISATQQRKGFPCRYSQANSNSIANVLGYDEIYVLPNA